MSRMESILVTFDTKHLFIGFKNGNLIQMSVDTHTVTRDYGIVYPKGIISMVQTRDGDWLIIGTSGGWVKIISMKGAEFTFPKFWYYMKFVYAIIMGPQDESFFVWVCDMDLI